MIVLAHRGCWSDGIAGNSREAMALAFRQGFGVETDIRDHDGELVISHDPPVGRGLLTLRELLHIRAEANNQAPMALNIKSDGLQGRVQAEMREWPGTDHFFFDMSVPDALQYLRLNLPTFTRQSQYEPQPAFMDKALGVWVDCFDGVLPAEKVIADLCAAGKRVALVSPELHRKDHHAAWGAWRSLPHHAMMVCTDHPHQAESFFNGTH